MPGVSPLRKLEYLGPVNGDVAAPPERWWKANECSYNSRKMPIDTIVIHATAGSSSSGAMSVTNGCNASWHYLIPDENESAHGEHAWICVPVEKKAWHVLRRVQFPIDGKTDINSRSIGFEIVNAQHTGDQFSDWQYQITAHIINYWRKQLGSIKYLTTHSYLDPSRRNDPGHTFDWDRFMALINEGIEPIDVDAYAKDAVQWAQESGLMVGYPDGRFGGRDPLSRQDAAVVLKRFSEMS